jgi:hypothetical protein
MVILRLLINFYNLQEQNFLRYLVLFTVTKLIRLPLTVKMQEKLMVMNIRKNNNTYSLLIIINQKMGKILS